MRDWGKLAFAAAAPLMLASCLWGPGKFASDLQLRKDGSFTLDYRGEILLQMPNDDKFGGPEPWSEKNARCTVDGRISSAPVVEIVTSPPDGKPDDNRPPPKERACTRAELAKAKADHDKVQAERIEDKRREKDQMAKIFGLPGADDESNRRFAATMMKYQGWRSVRYVGKGVFDVDYHFEGRVGQDYAFPMMPDADYIIPFITIRRRNDGAVMVTAPALTGGSGPFGARARMMGLPGKNDGPASRAAGTFRIITNGEILTNNSEDGPAPHPQGRQLKWDVDAASAKVPEALVKL